jgi:hypothetical protein
MIDVRPIARRTAAVVAAMILVGLSAPSQAQTGTLRVEIVKAGFIVGVGGGNGTLSTRGVDIPSA